MRAVDIIVAKRDGYELTTEQIDWLIGGFSRGEVADYQMSAWLMAVVWRGMTARETADLTRAMVASGRRLDLSSAGAFVADKHSTGGVGDKTTLVVAPLVASCGVPVGKMSGRGLGFSGGTLDKLESIPGFRVSLDPEEFLEGIKQVGMVVASQSKDLAPADGLMYALRDVTGTVDSLPLIAASIMSKKIAAGANGVVLDVKVGSGAFMKTLDDARALAVAMREIGESAGLKVRAVLSGMEQPLGYAVGNALEVSEAVDTLQGNGPADLVEVALTLGANLLELAGRCRTLDEGKALLHDALDTGRGLEVFRKFVRYQGGDSAFIEDRSLLPAAPATYDVAAEQDGWVSEIHADTIGGASVTIGAGRALKTSKIDPSVGFILRRKVGQRVARGDVLATVHAASDRAARGIAPEVRRAFLIEPNEVPVPPVVLGTV